MSLNNKNSFTQEQNNFIQKLIQFSELLNEMKVKALSEELTTAFANSIAKVNALKDGLQKGKLKIALVGAFSDGKTSTVAGFLGHADSNMKIAEEESSDEIIEYEPCNISEDLPPCVFVDTPGLFGQKFSEKTEKYISEAHIILYIVAATNPLKDSHKEMVSWLMKTLKKFDNTIFVINRMDDICDYTDEEDFAEKEKQKRAFLKENVARFCDLDINDSKIQNLNIVCISSDPEGKGLQENDDGKENYWLTDEHRSKYEEFSRMPNLRNMVDEVVKSTLPEKLMKDAALTAIFEEVSQNLEILRQEQIQLNEAVIPEVKRTVEMMRRDLSNTKKDLNREKRPCREELDSLERSICSKIRNATMETMREIVEDELGTGDDAGYKLNGKIQDILTDHFEQIVNAAGEKIRSDLDVGTTNVNDALSLVRKGIGGISNAAQGVNKAMVFAGRDLLGKVGVVIKFKPWGAVKLTNFISKEIPAIGAAVGVVLDVVDVVMAKINAGKLEKTRNELLSAVQGAFKSVYDEFLPENFINTFAPQIIEMEQQIESTEKKLLEFQNAEMFCNEAKTKMLRFWKNEAIDAEIVDEPTRNKGFFRRFFGR
ncbi:LeoA/HP0731 family dynamin-like GTPase [uncultured Fibrobacter sp.]|uniref:LeoA/HP0731 family dynamin-like GTPase n=1 Tax=uncultured Fibrobacter sp. TaxID=261512 RepID=UPI002616F2CB|nr:LeoA/HP0731 family dynamin-like GTPase [uncultured Fibrobacter sp.]